MIYKLDLTNLHIWSSYRIHKKDMRRELKSIAENAAEQGVITDVFQRSFFSLKMEWIAHNFLYKIGYKRDQTKDVDLDNPCDHPEWLYIICGLSVWLFVW